LSYDILILGQIFGGIMLLYQYIDNFLNHMRVEKSASAMTIISYRTDLSQFFGFLAEQNNVTPQTVGTELINHRTVREYLNHLQNMVLSRSTTVRKLAALRSYIQYLCRE